MDYWLDVVGERIEAKLSENAMVYLACRCIWHAFDINRTLFARRVPAAPFHAMERVVAAIEQVTGLADLALLDIDKCIDEFQPAPDSAEGLVPGWMKLVDAFIFLGHYPHDRDGQGLFYAIGSAYDSVMSRAATEFFQSESSCCYLSDMRNLEEQDPYCSVEIAYQLAQIDQVREERVAGKQ